MKTLDEILESFYNAGELPTTIEQLKLPFKEREYCKQYKRQIEKLIEQRCEEYADKKQAGLLERLNSAMFFSSANPNGQFVKDCIFRELNKIEQHRFNNKKGGRL